MNVVTKEQPLKEILPDRVEELSKRTGIKPEELILVRKFFLDEKAEVDKKDGTLIHYISTGAKDRDGDYMLPEGAKVKNYKKNPVVLYAHDYRSLPIGNNVWLKKDEKGWLAKTEFSDSEFAQQIKGLYDKKILRAWSVGFIPIKWENIPAKEETQGGQESITISIQPGRKYLEWELLEYSAVPIPSNPEALTLAMQNGTITDKKLKAYFGEIIKAMKEDEGESIDKESVMKPYPNEHACRVKNPGAFQEGSFRRVRREHKGKEYWVIMGRLKGETTMTEQAYRYNKKIWTAATARVHCKAHNGKFEAAQKEILIEIEEKNLGYFVYRCPECDAKVELRGGSWNVWCPGCGSKMETRKDSEKEELKESPKEVIVVEGDGTFIQSIALTLAGMKDEIAELKEGRVLSKKNRTLIKNCLEQLEKTAEALTQLLKATEPSKDDDAEEDEKIAKTDDDEGLGDDYKPSEDDDDEEEGIEIEIDEEDEELIEIEEDEIAEMVEKAMGDLDRLSQRVIDKQTGKITEE